jgi:hypothetical protein
MNLPCYLDEHSPIFFMESTWPAYEDPRPPGYHVGLPFSDWVSCPKMPFKLDQKFFARLPVLLGEIAHHVGQPTCLESYTFRPEDLRPEFGQNVLWLNSPIADFSSGYIRWLSSLKSRRRRRVAQAVNHCVRKYRTEFRCGEPWWPEVYWMYQQLRKKYADRPLMIADQLLQVNWAVASGDDILWCRIYDLKTEELRGMGAYPVRSHGQQDDMVYFQYAVYDQTCDKDDLNHIGTFGFVKLIEELTDRWPAKKRFDPTVKMSPEDYSFDQYKRDIVNLDNIMPTMFAATDGFPLEEIEPPYLLGDKWTISLGSEPVGKGL